MPTYFSLAEFLRSDTAAARNIDNTPSWEVVDHLRELADNLLDPLRVAWGKAIRVTSGHRCTWGGVAFAAGLTLSIAFSGTGASVTVTAGSLPAGAKTTYTKATGTWS